MELVRKLLKDLNVKNMILISRTKKKIIGLDGFGLKIKKNNNNENEKVLIVNANYYNKLPVLFLKPKVFKKQ